MLTMNYVKEKMDEIQQEMRELYLKDRKPFVLLFSHGKDSTLVVLTAWKMLLTIPPERRTKLIHIITSDTRVETPSFTRFVNEGLELIEEAVKTQGLPIVVHRAEPKVRDSFFYQVIGKGNPPPTQTSKRYRWCTSKMKSKPVAERVNDILAELPPSYPLFDGIHAGFEAQFDALMILGVREDESSNRKQSIAKYALHDKFAKHAEHKNMLVYHPIKYLTTDEVWEALLTENGGMLPWGLSAHDLFALYSEFSSECPLTQVDGKQNSSCGGGRMGCWTCAYVGKQDKMLINLIENGEDELIALLEWKQLMMDMQYDIRYREPLRRMDKREILRPLPRLSDSGEPLVEEDYFKRVQQWEVTPGPITIEGRMILLGTLLQAEIKSGQELISPEEIDAIVEAWAEDDYEAKLEDLQPKSFDYPGALLLEPTDKEAKTTRINTKTTTNPYPVFTVVEEFDQSLEEVVAFLDDRALKTGKHFFYLMGSVDYHKDFKLPEGAPILNQVQFIVCEKDVTTQHEANMCVEHWMGADEPKGEFMDWDSFLERHELVGTLF